MHDDPLGRPRGAPLAFVLAAVATVGALVAGGLGARRVPAREVVGLGAATAACLLLVFAVVWVRPRPRASVEAGARVLRIARWRRIVTVLLVQVFWFVFQDWSSPARLAGGALMIPLSAFVWWLMSRTARFTDEFVENVSGPGARFHLRWADVAEAKVYAGGVELRDGSGRAFRVLVRYCDGYPELAAVLRDRLPAHVLDARPNARELLSRAASLLENSSG